MRKWGTIKNHIILLFNNFPCESNWMLFIIHYRLYHANDGRITINLNATICGDFTVSLYHARNALKGMGRPQGIKICQFQMHTGFIAPQETLIHLDKTELDDLPDVEHIPMNFNVSIPIQVHDADRPPASNPPWIPMKAPRTTSALFGSQLEYEENVDNFSKYHALTASIHQNNKNLLSLLFVHTLHSHKTVECTVNNSFQSTATTNESTIASCSAAQTSHSSIS